MTSKVQVLVVDDEAAIMRFLKPALEANDYEMTSVGTVADAIKRIAAHAPDIVLLDLGLPDGDGKEVIKRAREWSDVPIIVLSARERETEKIESLDLGADDYVTKPFSVRELILRIRAVLRRSDAEGAAEDVITFGRLTVVRTAHRVYVDGAEVVLTALEFRLLSTLIDRRNRVQSRDALLADVWGLQMHVETRTVDTHIKRLREKLGAAGEYIHTVRGVGYRFASDPGDPGG